jgi:hypothetical protein
MWPLLSSARVSSRRAAIIVRRGHDVAEVVLQAHPACAGPVGRHARSTVALSGSALTTRSAACRGPAAACASHSVSPSGYSDEHATLPSPITTRPVCAMSPSNAPHLAPL